MGTAGTLIWGGLLLTGLLICYRLWRDMAPDWAMAWTLALNVLVMPYAWTWDFVMLVPLFLRIGFHVQGWAARGLLMLGYALVWAGVLWLRVNGPRDDSLMWWLPWLMLASMLLAWRIGNSEKQLITIKEPDSNNAAQ